MGVNGGSRLENLMKDGKMTFAEAKMHIRNGDDTVTTLYGKSPVQEAIDAIDTLNESELLRACEENPWVTDPEKCYTLLELAKMNQEESGGFKISGLDWRNPLAEVIEVGWSEGWERIV